MENYIVSARKYRPDTFDTVVGQEALTTTLKNAISSNKLAHAYLFCGPRGVGKTTCARIFAKTINCLNKTKEGEACNECESCLAFNEQRSYNIHELDAASNNSVDDIRQIIEMVRIPPQIGKYQVFVIDEVHMLSTQAFNAFLKTLEEPPAHAVFILATTEKHKLLPTILSRCQIYDFNRISVQAIVNHLSRVALEEKVQAEPEALNVIAVKADGGMRDALSMFDQAVSYTRGNLTYQGVLENLNVLDYDYYFRLTDAFLAKNISDCLLLFNEVLSKGFEGNSFVVGLNSHFRDLLVSKDAATLQLLETTATIRERYQEQAKKCTDKFLFRALKICRDCEINFRASKNKRLLVELALIEVAQATDDDGERPSGQSKKLKPIFKDSAKPKASGSSQPTPTPQVIAKDGRVDYSNTNAQVQTKTPSAQAANPVSTSSTGVLNQIKQTGKKIPVVSIENMGGVSIRNLKNKNKTTVTNDVVVERTEKIEKKKELRSTAVTAGDLNYQWQSFINRMPIDLKALSVRMRAIRIELLEGTFQFEIVVDNELAENEFKSIKRDVETALQSALNNDYLEMLVRVSEPDENIRPYTKVERYKLMAETNPALIELKNAFGLEFN